MEGLFYCKTTDGKYITLHLIRFYENSGYVIVKSVTGDLPYFTKQLKNFAMDGHIVKGEPEFTFCGAYSHVGNSLSFKVENEVIDTSDTWVAKDVLSFKGVLNNETELNLKQISKRTKFEIERVYIKSTEEEILKSIE